MSAHFRSIASYLYKLLADIGEAALLERLRPKRESLPAARCPAVARISDRGREQMWRLAGENPRLAEIQAVLVDERTLAEADRYEQNIENFIGTVKLPVGLAGPLRVNGLFAQGDYCVPLATSEAALVASYHRGALLLTEAGGCTVALLAEGVSRAPGFAFRDIGEAGRFVVWAAGQMDAFRACAEATTRHGKLVDQWIWNGGYNQQWELLAP